MNNIEHFPLMIPGSLQTDGKALEVFSPYDGSLIATVTMANAKSVEQALLNARALFEKRNGWLTQPQRIAILEKAVDLMSDRAEALAVEAAREGGKPLLDSRIEMVRCIDSINICIHELRTHAGESIPMGSNAASAGRLAVTSKEPIGVVVAVSAFNHPLNLIAHQIGPAIATGCPVIVKPAADTPLSCIRLVKLFSEAGLPDGWCQFVMPESRELSEELVSDERVAFFSFIGSPGVGWYLRSKLAAGTRCALEHGGAAPVIVAADADIDRILPSLMKGAFYHAGQVCVSVQRIFAHKSIAKALAEKIKDAAVALVVGDPLSDKTEVGPLIREKEAERVHQWVQQAVAAEADLMCGGNRLENNCYAPTVIFSPPLDVNVSTKEIFGPVVCIYPYEDIDRAIEIANSLDVAFQASVFSRDIDTALYAANRLAASAVMINDHTAFRVDWMPFAGLRRSGLGVGGIPYTMHDMQIEKMIVIQSGGLS
ncbi:aldehyde dehydrogenase family protein [Mariprofundus sp. NF]|uniref:aldehyde dehydrogenase family protein n=1 Tax=Mariprofundus sp. NF TaxID=2608716 RepID=UPI00159FC613|nr:aldehyde dehydrogenase family protein [Mariprofundus sp. NF]NWF39198.1 aldehyde dehydrogenase family protein [Mariprofundus sp. NF]